VKVTIVGSGTLLPDDLHRSAGHFVDWSGGGLLLDCGSGVVHGLARDGLDWRAISHVAISHFHTDHMGDLPALLWAWRHGISADDARPKTLLGPVGLRRLMNNLATTYGEFILNPGSGLRVVELGRGVRWSDPGPGLVIRTCGVPHTPEALAFRVVTDEGEVGYTGDTGPHPPLGDFFRGVDILIAECAVPDSAPMDVHLAPSDVARLAQAATPGHLVLTHLYPGVPRPELPGIVRAGGFQGRVTVARDGESLSLHS